MATKNFFLEKRQLRPEMVLMATKDNKEKGKKTAAP